MSDSNTSGLIQSIRPYIKLLRPEIADMDVALPAASALLAAYLSTGGFPGLFYFIIAVAAAYIAITSSYVLNDYCDVDIDTINLPDRPLPSSQISKNNALIYAVFLMLIAGSVAFYLNPETLVVFIIAASVITFYSSVAKRATYLSFFPVGISYGLVPIGVWLVLILLVFLKEMTVLSSRSLQYF